MRVPSATITPRAVAARKRWRSVNRRTRWQPQQWIGAALLAHFAIVLSIKLHKGLGAEIWWISHAALLIAGVGLAARSSLLVSTALTSILVFHLVWLLDFGTWLYSGVFPLKITGYLADADCLTWIATLHHFYLVPLLIAVFLCDRQYPREALLASLAVFLYLTVVSGFALSPAANVNFAFAVLPGFEQPFIEWINGLSRTAYLLALNGTASGLIFLPTALVLRRFARRSVGTSAQSITEYAASTPQSGPEGQRGV